MSAILGKLVAANVPFYDYEDRLKTLLERLVEKGKKSDVIAYAERLRGLPGIQDFFNRLPQGA